jgi:hypothetical protein
MSSAWNVKVGHALLLVFCIGTPGEYLAADAFGLKLLPGNSKDFDAETELGERVQIRTSGKGSYIPIHGGEGLLLVVRIRRTDDVTP